jgi:hypothetical protein
MKKVSRFLALPLFVLLLLNAVSAQTSVNTKFIGNDGAMRVYDMYDDAGNRIKTAGEMGVNGDPMLHGGWATGVVRFQDGKVFADTAMNFSLVEKKLYYALQDRLFQIVLPVKEFSLHFENENGDSTVYHFRSGFPAIDDNDATSLYQVLFEGDNMQLLQWNHKKVREIFNYGSGSEKVFELVQQLYVFFPKERIMTAVKPAIPAIKKTLPTYSKSIEAYFSTHKLNTKDKGQMADLVAYLDKHR